MFAEPEHMFYQPFKLELIEPFPAAAQFSALDGLLEQLPAKGL